jgi:hypothetical protein
MDGVDVGSNIFARYTRFATDKKVILYFANIGSTLDISGATLGELDLTSTSIGTEFRLGSGLSFKPNWSKGSKMYLWNTSVGAIQDAEVDSWPEELELEGFTYERLGGFGSTGSDDIAKRKSKDFIQWLERDKTFSPQPYEYLAKVLNEAGFPSKANAIRYAGRKRSRREAIRKTEGKPREWLRWLGLTLLQSTIGYGLGIRYFRVLAWLLVFTFIGFLVLLNTMEENSWNFFKMAWASFDVTLPVVTLNQEYESFIFENSGNGVKTYFYFQKIVGYILGGFLVAGLSGLTQKNS